MMPSEITINLEYRVGTWFVESPQIPGLLTHGGTIPLALEAAAQAVYDLAIAVAYAHADGEQLQPIFRETPRHQQKPETETE
jgi:predicted RNase H-like HicB family nuclease